MGSRLLEPQNLPICPARRATVASNSTLTRNTNPTLEMSRAARSAVTAAFTEAPAQQTKSGDQCAD